MATPFDPVQIAFERAIDDFRSQLKDDAVYDEILQITSIQQVYDATDKLQAEQSKNGRLRHLSKIEPYLARLSDYTDAAGIFIQAKPDVLALIWGPVVLLLQWASVLKTSFDAIVNTTAEIGSALPEFHQAIQIFDQNNQIKDVLLFFFKDILDFYLVALRFFRLPRWRLLFEALWPKHREKIRVVRTDIDRHTLLLRREVQFEHIQREHEARSRSLAHFEATENAHRRQEYRGIVADISPKVYDGKLNWLQGRTCIGTGNWLLRDATFIQWLKATEKSQRLLWLQGIPGAGKTFLSSIVVNRTRLRGRTLFAFLSYTHTSSTSALSIAHSLIFQLASHDENMQTAMCEMSRDLLKSSLDVAFEILCKLLAYAGTVYIVIDGVDEIDEVERNLLLRRLILILRDCDGVNVLVSSRLEADIKTLLDDQSVSIRVDNRNIETIETYIDLWTKDWFKARQASPQVKFEIERWLAPLASKSEGMFLYVKLVLSGIEFLDDFTEIENELSVLPKTLDDAYARILLRVNNLPSPSSRQKARRLLGWIACSPAPLTVHELQQALTIKSNDTEGKTRLLADLEINKICGPIVEVVDGYVQFVHFTVKEYITSPQIVGHIDIEESTLSLTMSCLTYLCQQHHDSGFLGGKITESLLGGTYVIHEFAATNWLELVKRSLKRCSKDVPPLELIHLLERLSSDRTNDEYCGKTEDVVQSATEKLKDKWPELHNLMLNAAYFRHVCSTSEYRIQEGSTWTCFDPLTISRVSVVVQEMIDSLLLCAAQQHNSSCNCGRIRIYHGPRPFKCSFIHCDFHRQGFETQQARSSHEKNHDRPWKCSVPTCEYASGGFLSRKMRDDHLDRYHQTLKSTSDLARIDSDPSEVQALLFDLVQADNVDAMRSLLPSLKQLPQTIKDDLRVLAAASGSPSMLDSIMGKENSEMRGGLWLFTDVRSRNVGGTILSKVVFSAITNENAKTFKYLLYHYYLDGRITEQEFGQFLLPAWRSDSTDILDVWEDYVNDTGEQRLFQIVKIYTLHGLQAITTRNPIKEQKLLDVWKKRNFAKTLGQRPKSLSEALIRVAILCCSVKLARFLIEAGADVNHRKHDNQLPVLHHVARKTSSEAADLMRYLLQCGADPDSYTNLVKGKGSLRRRVLVYVRDEKGAKEISKWLGVSWDELVAQTKTDREEQKACVVQQS